MKVIVKLSQNNIDDIEVNITKSAAEHVRFNFNPSGLRSVNKLKALAAAFIAVCDELEQQNQAAAGEFAVAKMNAQQASMWAVSGATKGL